MSNAREPQSATRQWRQEFVWLFAINGILPECMILANRLLDLGALLPGWFWLAFGLVLACNLWRLWRAVDLKWMWIAAIVVALFGFVLLGMVSPVRALLAMPWVVGLLVNSY